MRIPPHRLTRHDWIGDSALMLIAGAASVVAVFLPWATTYNEHFVNFSLGRPAGVVGVLHTQWGPPVLAAGLAMIAVALVMLAVGPRLPAVLLSLLGIVAGVVCIVSAMGAADSMVKMYRPGLGLFVALLTGILLVPIAISSALVGLLLWMRRPEAAAPGA